MIDLYRFTVKNGPKTSNSNLHVGVCIACLGVGGGSTDTPGSEIERMMVHSWSQA